MSRRHRCALVAISCAAAACAARAQDRQPTLATGPEAQTELTASLVTAPDGKFYIRDNADREVFAVDKGVITRASRRASTAVNERAGALSLAAPASQLARDSTTSGRLRLLADGSELEVTSKSGKPLIDARLLREIGNSAFVIQEELDSSAGTVAVRRFIVSYDQAAAPGAGRAVAELDVGNVEVIDDSYIAIMDGLKAMHLAEQGGKIVVKYLPLDSEIEVASAPARGGAELAAPDRGASGDDFTDRFRNSVRAIEPRPEANLLLPPPTRAAVLANARRFLEASWTLSDANFGRSRESMCQIAAKIWLRPRRLDSMRGMPVVALPYKWGGYMSVERFLQRMQQGALAGDTCTCRSPEHNFCLVQEAAGVDCSGFVSQIWGIDYETTSSLHDVADPINWEELRPGDALNKAGSHVRLFVRFEDDARTSVRIAESAINCGGVCEHVLSASQFDGYKPIRLKGILE